MKNNTSLFVFRRDLRLQDNTGLIQALENSKQVVTLFVVDEYLVTRWKEASHRLSFLSGALLRLADELAEQGGGLLIREGNPVEVVPAVAKEVGAEKIYMNRDYAAYARRRDRQIYERCLTESLPVSFHGDQLLQEPEHVHKADGSPYQVFTPFYRAAARLPVRKPLEFSGVALSSLDGGESTKGIIDSLSPPTSISDIDPIIQISKLKKYQESRDFPDQMGTSRLSAFLRFGLVSPRQVYDWSSGLEEPEPFRRQLYWRDFYHHIGWHFPHVYRGSFRSEYDRLSWLDDPELFQAWTDGRTGFPIVDAGMRELKATGYMHNRVRMIVASFLTKNLQISWRKGERFFARHLIDFDPAANNGNWQWSASTGCDAQPYFRIFNPWRQQKRFDPECAYVKKWIPELSCLDARSIHGLEKNSAGYMPQIVELKTTAEASIDRFKLVKK